MAPPFPPPEASSPPPPSPELFSPPPPSPSPSQLLPPPQEPSPPPLEPSPPPPESFSPPPEPLPPPQSPPPPQPSPPPPAPKHLHRSSPPPPQSPDPLPPQPPQPPPPDGTGTGSGFPDSQSKSTSTGLIAGAVVGGIAAALAVGNAANAAGQNATAAGLGTGHGVSGSSAAGAGANITSATQPGTAGSAGLSGLSGIPEHGAAGASGLAGGAIGAGQGTAGSTGAISGAPLGAGQGATAAAAGTLQQGSAGVAAAAAAGGALVAGAAAGAAIGAARGAASLPRQGSLAAWAAAATDSGGGPSPSSLVASDPLLSHIRSNPVRGAPGAGCWCDAMRLGSALRGSSQSSGSCTAGTRQCSCLPSTTAWWRPAALMPRTSSPLCVPNQLPLTRLLGLPSCLQLSRGSTVRSSRSSADTQRWELTFDELTILQQIGEGSFGRVFYGLWHETPVAIKASQNTVPRQQGVRWARSRGDAPSPVLPACPQEAGLLASLRHPNCITFLAVCRSPPCIITEYCGRGSLTHVLMAARRDPAVARKLIWTRRLSMLLDAALGMLYLHSRAPAIVHRDLKSPNLLVDDSWHVKVSDFNLSRFVEEHMKSKGSSMAATNPRWLAPEVMRGQRATKAADVFAFGVVMWEVLTWQVPWTNVGPWQLVNLLVSGSRLEIPPLEQLPGSDTPQFAGLDAYVALMRRCWAQDPAERPTFEQVIPELRALRTLAAQHKSRAAHRRGGSSPLPATPTAGTPIGSDPAVAVGAAPFAADGGDAGQPLAPYGSKE
ncbi:hypothetical protein ABPG77_006110 [Micractinium sp. CCAP 211/92]